MSSVDKVVRLAHTPTGMDKIKALAFLSDQLGDLLALGGHFIQLPNGRMNGSEPGAGKPPTGDHSPEAINKIMDAYVRGPIGDTQRQFKDPVTGLYSPERAAAHAEILKEALDKVAGVPRERQALVMGGLPGAGKSSALSNPEFAAKLGAKVDAHGDPTNMAPVNPDLFKEALAQRGMVPEVPGGAHLSPMERSAAVHEESSDLAKAYQEQLQRQGTNIFLDGTMAPSRGDRISAKMAGKMESLNSGTDPKTGEVHPELGGYKMTTAFISVSTHDQVAADGTRLMGSISRAQARYESQQRAYEEGRNNIGGRIVPPDAHAGLPGDMRSQNQQVWTETRTAPGVVRSLLFDNMVPRGSPAILLMDSAVGT